MFLSLYLSLSYIIRLVVVHGVHAPGHDGVGDATESAPFQKLRQFKVVLGACVLTILEKDLGNPCLTNKYNVLGDTNAITRFDSIRRGIVRWELLYVGTTDERIGGPIACRNDTIDSDRKLRGRCVWTVLSTPAR